MAIITEVPTMTDKYFIIDFDSTFLQVEALEELADISLRRRDDRDLKRGQIVEITKLGVDGRISFNESVTRRIRLLEARQSQLGPLIDRLKQKVSTSIVRNKAFFEQYSDQIYIISNGFKEFIIPVVADYGIDADHVLANTFVLDEQGMIVGLDEENPLAHSGGKSKALAALGLEGELNVIGDAYTDYEMKEAGVADKFYAFTENVVRENILGKADHITPSFDEFLYVNNLPMAISYPKNRIKVLILENIHTDAIQTFQREGYQVEVIGRALSEDELCEKIKGVSIIGIRSKTQITRKVLEHANRLMVVGAFCIGTNQIDLEAASDHGVVVFNAPYSNTRSVVELAIGEMIMLMRRIPSMSAGMHQGKWNKSAKESFEIRGKKLGIIGYGNIGAQLSVLAEAMGMKVYYYDLIEKLALGNAIKIDTLDELLQISDVVSWHVDGRPENQLLMGEHEFAMMKPGSIFINLSRGSVVDIEALAGAVKSGHIRGAAIDVFPSEPKSNAEPFKSELLGLDQVILTPHIGGSTQEAQQNIGSYVPARILDYINSGNTFGSVNFPNIQLPAQKDIHRLLHIHRNIPGIMAGINQILARYELNVVGQYLKTTEELGYVIFDINQQYQEEMVQALREIDGTIKFRVLY